MHQHEGQNRNDDEDDDYPDQPANESTWLKSENDVVLERIMTTKADKLGIEGFELIAQPGGGFAGDGHQFFAVFLAADQWSKRVVSTRVANASLRCGPVMPPPWRR